MGRLSFVPVIFWILVFSIALALKLGFHSYLKPKLLAKAQEEVEKAINEQLKAKTKLGKLSGGLFQDLGVASVEIKDPESKEVVLDLKDLRADYDLFSLWRYRRAPGLILKRLKIGELKVVVIRDKEGKINWQNYAPPPPEEKKPPVPIQFDWELTKATVVFRDYYDREQPFEQTIRLSARGTNVFFPHALLSAHLELAGAEADVRLLFDQKKRRLWAKLSGDLDVARLLKLAPAELPIAVEKGTAKVEAVAASKEELEDLHAVSLVELRDIRAEQKEVGTLTIERAELVGYEDMLYIANLKAAGMGSQVQAAGWVTDFQKGVFIAEADARTRLAHLRRLNKNVPRDLSGDLQSHVVAYGSKEDQFVFAPLTGRNIEAEQLHLPALSANLQFAGKKLLVDVQAQALEGRLTASGWVETGGKRPRGQFAYEGEGLALAALPAKRLPVPVAGEARSIGLLQFSSPVRVLAAAQLSDLKVSEQSVDQVTALAHWDGRKATLFSAGAFKEQAAVFAEGEASPEELDIWTDAFGLTPELVPQAQGRVRTSAHLSGRLEGPVKSPHFLGEVFAGPTTLVDGERQLSLWGLKLEVDGSPDRVALRNGEIYQFGAVHEFAGEIFPQTKELDLRWVANEVSLNRVIRQVVDEEVLKQRPQLEDLTGWATVSAQVQGSFEQPKASLDIKLSPLRQGEKVLIDGAKLVAGYAGGVVTIPEGEVSIEGEKLTLAGTVVTGEKGAWDLKIEGSQIPLAAIPVEDIRARGLADLLLTMKGPFFEPKLHLHAEGKSWEVRGVGLERFALDMPWDLAQGKGSLEQVLGFEEGKIKTTGTMDAPLLRQVFDQMRGAEAGGQEAQGASALFSIDTVTEVDGFRLGQVLEAFPETEGIDGWMEARVEGKVDINQVPGGGVSQKFRKSHAQVALKDLSVRGEKIDSFDTAFSFSEEEVKPGKEQRLIDLEKLAVVTPTGQLMAQGRLAIPEGEPEALDLQVQGEGIELAVLEPVLGEGTLEGVGTIQLVVSGTRDKPEAFGVLRIRDGKLMGEELKEAKAKFVYRDNLMNLQELAVKTALQGVRLVAKIPLVLQPAPRVPGDEPLQATLEIEPSDLTTLPKFVPSVVEAQGKVEGKVELAGTLGAPQWEGEVKLTDGSFITEAVKSRIEDLLLHLSFHEQGVELKELSGAIGGGRFTSRGLANFSAVPREDRPLPAFRLDRWDFRFQGEPMNLDLPPSFKGRLHVKDFAFAGTFDEPRLSGDFEIDQTRYQLIPSKSEEPFDPTKLPPFLQRLLFDVKVRIGEDFWVMNQAMRMKMDEMKPGEEIHFTGTIPSPTVKGALVSSRGRLAMFNVQFNMEEAVIYFGKPFGQEDVGPVLPIIFARAQSKVDVKEESPLRKKAPGCPMDPLLVEVVLDGPVGDMEAEIRAAEGDKVASCRSLSREDLILALSPTAVFEGASAKEALQESVTDAFKVMLAGALFAKIETQVEELLGISEFRFDVGDQGDVRVVLGEKVLPNLLLRYDRTFEVQFSEKIEAAYEIDPDHPVQARGFLGRLASNVALPPLKAFAKQMDWVILKAFDKVAARRYLLKAGIQRQQGARTIENYDFNAEVSF